MLFRFRCKMFGRVADFEAPTIKGANKLIQYPSRRWPNTVLEFLHHSSPARRVGTSYFRCKRCFAAKKRDKNNGPIPMVTVQFGDIVTDPDYPKNPHYCQPITLAAARAENAMREARSECRRSGKRHRNAGVPPIISIRNIAEDAQRTIRSLNSQPGDPEFDEKFILWKPQQPQDPDMILFSTPEALGYLRNSAHVICDGNFKFNPVRPFRFSQLYTIHGFVQGESFPFIYALLPNKTELAYSTMFSTIRVELLRKFPDLGRINGGLWHFDYEDGARNAFETVFPEARFKGCVFHYSQALIKNRNRLGLMQAYAEVPEVFQFFRRLVALCLLPPWMVPLAANDILTAVPVTGNIIQDYALADFVLYFRQEWLRDGYIERWNHWDNDGPRTTNHAEGWHNSLRHKLPHEHPALGIFVHHAKRWWHADSIRIRNLILNPAANPPAPRRAVDIRNDQQIDQAKLDLHQYFEHRRATGQLIEPARVLQFLDHVEHRLGNRH